MGLGAQKAGTSWWDALIGRHPAVVRAAGLPKELHYFDRAWAEPLDDPDIARYTATSRGQRGAWPGSGRPATSSTSGHPGCWRGRRRRPASSSSCGTRSTASAPGCATSWRPREHHSTRATSRLRSSAALYAPQLRRVLAAFPAEQVFIGQYEACRAAPARELARTYAFLGLAPFEPDSSAFRGEVNPTTGPSLRDRPVTAASLIDAYAPDLAQLPTLVPGLDLSLWPTAREVGLAQVGRRRPAVGGPRYQSSQSAEADLTSPRRRRPSPVPFVEEVGLRHVVDDVRPQLEARQPVAVEGGLHEHGLHGVRGPVLVEDEVAHRVEHRDALDLLDGAGDVAVRAENEVGAGPHPA